VKQHEGHVDVTSTPGEGATFSLYLPTLVAQKPQSRPPRTDDLVQGQGQGQTILVVEDSDVTREAVVRSLELLNYQVLEAANGREALALLEQQADQAGGDGDQIELVLSDMVMPEMGGRALFYELRQRDPTIKVVLLTGHPLKEDLVELQTQGLSGWLLKPPSLEQLAEVIAQALAEGQSQA
jgi:two-component system cell cycle sensor histidine kinase/response regulator CckA